LTSSAQRRTDIGDHHGGRAVFLAQTGGTVTPRPPRRIVSPSNSRRAPRSRRHLALGPTWAD
jgi:hypothetical protein